MMRAVIDPNVLVSSRISDMGFPARIVRAANERRFEIFVSEKLIAELSDVLMRPRFRRYATEEAVGEFLFGLRDKGTLFEDIEAGRLVPDDPKDDYLIALARTSGADFLVSGDPDLHSLETPPEVLTPRRFWELLEREANNT